DTDPSGHEAFLSEPSVPAIRGRGVIRRKGIALLTEAVRCSRPKEADGCARRPSPTTWSRSASRRTVSRRRAAVMGVARRCAASPFPLSLLICVGGDGTLDTVTAAAAARSAPLLAVGAGFGNLFARALGQPTRVERAVALVECGEVVHVDVGLRNRDTFLCQE